MDRLLIGERRCRKGLDMNQEQLKGGVSSGLLDLLVERHLVELRAELHQLKPFSCEQRFFSVV